MAPAVGKDPLGLAGTYKEVTTMSAYATGRSQLRAQPDLDPGSRAAHFGRYHRRWTSSRLSSSCR